MKKKKSKIKTIGKQEIFEDWFQRIYESNFESLFRYAYAVTKNRQLAEDVVSEVFLNILNNPPDHENIRELSTYLRVSVKHLAIRILSKDLRRFSLSNYTEYQEISDTINPEHLLLGKELDTIISEVINSLPPEIHLVFDMSRNKGYSHEEISQRLGISKRTVENRIYRVLKKMKQRLSSHFKEPEINYHLLSRTGIANIGFFLLTG